VSSQHTLVVISQLPQLSERIRRCLNPDLYVVVHATTIAEVRGRTDRLDVLAVDGEQLAKVGWRGHAVVESLVPDRSMRLLGIIRRDHHRPPRDVDLTKFGVIPLYEPFLAPELAFAVGWLAQHIPPPQTAA
jgi:hypothetical protein